MEGLIFLITPISLPLRRGNRIPLVLTTLLKVVFLLPFFAFSQKGVQPPFLYTSNYPLEQAMFFASYAPPLPASQTSGLIPYQEEILLSVTDVTFLPVNVSFQEPLRKGIQEYEIKPGDTIASIAQAFNLKAETILWGNNLTSQSSLKPGRVLRILPLDGVLHKVRQGETVGELSLLYQVYTEDIIEINELSADGFIVAGDTIVIPGGKALPPKPKRYIPPLAEFKAGLTNPAPGSYRSQGLHFNNAVDLANRCGSPVLAAAAGRVINVKNTGWNGGFGRYVMLEHQDGVITVYGHLKEAFASINEFINQGRTIGVIGTTGRATGCHVHFEVRGARNPFVN